MAREWSEPCAEKIGNHTGGIMGRGPGRSGSKGLQGGPRVPPPTSGSAEPDQTLPASEPAVTVVICTHDRSAELAECLASLQRAPAIEVLVVDNAPSNDAARRVCESAGARYVLEPVPGLSKARNTAWKAAQADIVVYLDDDARPEHGWLQALLRPFGDASVMAATGQILPPHFHSAGPEAFRLGADGHDWRERTLFGGAGSGANMAFRRSFLEQWGGFDETIGRGRILSGGEEHEAFFCVVDRGFVLAYEPDAIVHHPHDGSQVSDPRTSVAFALHLFVKYPTLRVWLLSRFLRASTGRRGGTDRPGRRRTSLASRISAAFSGGALFIRNRRAAGHDVGGEAMPRPDAS